MKALLLGFLLLSFSILPAMAQEAVSSESGGLRQLQKIDYVLPYPGILPDNPLYFLKAMRDRVVSFLIADPNKKALFNLLQADKRLQSAVYLFYSGDSKKIKLAESTLSKGENYFEEAVSQLQSARSRGKNIDVELNRLSLAARKHLEVIAELSSQAAKDDQVILAGLKERVDKIKLKLSELKTSPNS